ncbi:hypothetical protein AC1031_020813 [Aphanomyces cochlioides]|nr:hypothetical protein AC1031_020813 [Aphanomyces cochlioides]
MTETKLGYQPIKCVRFDDTTVATQFISEVNSPQTQDMLSKLLLQDDDGQYTCPDCGARYKMRVRFTPVVPDEVKKANERSRRARAQDKRKAVRLLISLFKATPPRRLFSLRDARQRGCYGAARPIVVTGPSKIERAGAGMFACVDLLAGDVVTTYDGEVVFQVPQEPSYAIRYDFGATPAWIDGLQEFQNGKGVGSFVNRADREAHVYKNCDYIQDGNTLAIKVTKRVKAGEELFTTYGRSYRM